jgi:hypothetical protein
LWSVGHQSSFTTRETNTAYLVHTQGRSLLRPHPHNTLAQTNITQNGASWQLPTAQPATRKGTTTKYKKNTTITLNPISQTTIKKQKEQTAHNWHTHAVGGQKSNILVAVKRKSHISHPP